MKNEIKNENEERIENEARIIPKKKNWVPVAVVVLIIAVVACVYSCVMLMDSTTVYKKIVTGAVDTAFETVSGVSEGKEKTSVTMTLDMMVDLLDDEEEKNSPLVKALNDTIVKINAQLDSKAGKSVLHLESDCANEELFNVSMFMDLNTSKAYVYSKDLLDSYLEIDMTETETTTEDAVEPEEYASMLKAEKILKEELSKIVTEDMCSKENGAYVLKTTNIKLLENLKTAIEGLSENEEFLDCYENPEDIAESLTEINQLLDMRYLDEYQIEVRLELGLFFDFKAVSIKVWDNDGYEVSLNISDALVTFNVKEDNKDSMNVKLEAIDRAKEDEIKLSINDTEMGNIVVTMKITTNDLKTIDEMGSRSVKKMEELTFFEIMELTENFSESKLGKLSEEINEYNSKKFWDNVNQAISVTNEKQVQDLAALIWAEAYLDGLSGQALVNKVKSELAENDITDEDWDIEVSNTGVSITAKEKASSSGNPIIDKANAAILATDIATLNETLVLAYVDLKLNNNKATFDDSTKVTVDGVEYANATEYYKSIISNSSIPAGYELVVNLNGSASIEAK